MTLAFAPAPVVERIGWLLVYSVWQFALIALLMAIVLRVMRRAPAGVRYAVALVGWGLMLMAPALTWSLLPAPTGRIEIVAADPDPAPVDVTPPPVNAQAIQPSPAEALESTLLQVIAPPPSLPPAVVAA